MQLKTLTEKLAILNKHTGKQFYLMIGADNAGLFRYDENGNPTIKDDNYPPGYMEKFVPADHVQTMVDEINGLVDMVEVGLGNDNIWWLI